MDAKKKELANQTTRSLQLLEQLQNANSASLSGYLAQTTAAVSRSEAIFRALTDLQAKLHGTKSVIPEKISPAIKELQNNYQNAAKNSPSKTLNTKPTGGTPSQGNLFDTNQPTQTLKRENSAAGYQSNQSPSKFHQPVENYRSVPHVFNPEIERKNSGFDFNRQQSFPRQENRFDNTALPSFMQTPVIESKVPYFEQEKKSSNDEEDPFGETPLSDVPVKKDSTEQLGIMNSDISLPQGSTADGPVYIESDMKRSPSIKSHSGTNSQTASKPESSKENKSLRLQKTEPIDRITPTISQTGSTPVSSPKREERATPIMSPSKDSISSKSSKNEEDQTDEFFDQNETQRQPDPPTPKKERKVRDPAFAEFSRMNKKQGASTAAGMLIKIETDDTDFY